VSFSCCLKSSMIFFLFSTVKATAILLLFDFPFFNDSAKLGVGGRDDKSLDHVDRKIELFIAGEKS